MAHELDDGEFWLPPKFLSDDDVLMDFKTKDSAGERLVTPGNAVGFGFSGVLSPNSGTDSPVESLMGSTETESDEEDYLTGLTWKMAQSTLEDELWISKTGLSYDNRKMWAMAGSPQSTLCNVSGSCFRPQGSSRGSSTGPSPPATPAPNLNDADLDLLYAVAGEVARRRMAEEIAAYNLNNCSLLGRKPSPISVPMKSPNHSLNLGLDTKMNLAYHRLQAAQFELLKQQQRMKQQQYQHCQQLLQGRGRTVVNGRVLGSSSWPTLQQAHTQVSQQNGSGMRAVFLGNPTPKRECAGTGVFLPRQLGTLSEPRRKKGCSTVLLPDRVVQALNLNLESMDAQPQLRRNATFPPDHGTEMRYQNSVQMAQQRGSFRAATAMTSEVRLPQEWTY